MSIWASIGHETERIDGHLDEYGDDEPLEFDIATSGTGLVRFAGYGIRDGVFVSTEPLYVPADQIDLIISKLETAKGRQS